MERDYRSEHERRNERARQLGYRSYWEQRRRRREGRRLPADTDGRREARNA